MNACMWGTVHLDKDLDYNLHFFSTHGLSEIQSMFSVTQNGIHSMNDKEIFGLKTIAWDRTPWRSCTLQHDRTIKQVMAKGLFFGLRAMPRRQLSRISQIIRNVGEQNSAFRRLVLSSIVNETMWTASQSTAPRSRRVDGERTQSSAASFRRPHHLLVNVIFMSMYNDRDWTKSGNQEVCLCSSL